MDADNDLLWKKNGICGILTVMSFDKLNIINIFQEV